MGKCKLKKGDRIYECRYREAVLTELLTSPELTIQQSGSHLWYWQAKIVGTDHVVYYSITEEAPQYGPRLYRKNLYEVGMEQAEPILPPFDTSTMVNPIVCKVNISDDVELLGHVFHGLQDIEAHVEMSLYKKIRHGAAREMEPKVTCEVHVGEQWHPYPCFDAEDFATENRTYRSYLFRRQPLTQGDMQALSDLPELGNYSHIMEEMPAEMLPMVYYCGDGPMMVVATEV